MTLRAVSGVMVLGVACVALLSGCSRERIDWKSAESADTPEGYNHFLERHPSGELAAQAKARLAELVEQKDWQRASSGDTAEGYRQFLAQHPDGKFAEEARIRVENFALDANASPAGDASASSTASTSTAPTSTAAPGTPAEPPAARTSSARTSASTAAPGTPAEPPAASSTSARTSGSSTASTSTATSRTPGPPSKPAPVSPAASSGGTSPSHSATTPVASSAGSPKSDANTFGIQLGAFSTQAAALTEWKRLQVKFDPQLHGLFAHAVPAQVTSGTVFRLQSPVGEESRARNICAALTQQQQPCVVVLPNNH